MLASKLNRWLLVGSALLGAVAAGCGEEEDPAPATTFDSGTGQPDGGGAGLDASACYNLPIINVPGVTCTQSSGQPGYQLCTNGVPTGTCMSIVPDGGFNLGDASFTQGDSSVTITDGGFMVGDATISIEAGTLKCPGTTTCSQVGGLAGLPISACTDMGALFPPSCPTAGMACMLGTASGSCQNILVGNFCVVPCN